jgi:hypothetical protein
MDSVISGILAVLAGGILAFTAWLGVGATAKLQSKRAGTGRERSGQTETDPSD